MVDYTDNRQFLSVYVKYNYDSLVDWIWLVAVWLSGNALALINVVALRWARLVLGWVTIRGYTILVSNQVTKFTQPGHPSVGRRNKYWRWSQPPLGKNGEFCVTVGPVTGTA